MVSLSCLKQTQSNAEVNDSTKDITTPSKALPVTLLVISTLTVLVAALIGIPGLLSTTSSLNLPSSFAWIHAIGTPGLAAILGAGGALGLSVIALSSRRLCQATPTEILDRRDTVEQDQNSDIVQQDGKTGNTPSLNIIIAPFDQWKEVTDVNCHELVERPSLAEFYKDYPLEPGTFTLFHDISDNTYQAVTCKEEEGKQLVFFLGQIQETNPMTDEEINALDPDALGEYIDARSTKIEEELMKPPFNLKKYIP